MMSATQNYAHRKRMAFTLVELLVVIAIIAILLSILLPSVNISRRAGMAMRCQSQIRSLILASRSYADDFDNVIPHGIPFYSVDGYRGWSAELPRRSILVVRGYMPGDKNLFLCPQDDQKRRDLPGVWRYTRPPNFSYTRNAHLERSSDWWPDLDTTRNVFQVVFLMEEWEMSPMNDPWFYLNGWDLISGRHNGNGHMGFLDGRTESIGQAFFNSHPSSNRRPYIVP